MDAARRAWLRIYPLLDATLSVNYIAAVKTAMRAVGFGVGDPRPPFAALAGPDAARIAELAAAFAPST